MKRNTIIIIILSILATLAGFFWYVLFYIKKKTTISDTIPQTANQDLRTSKDINLSGILNRLDALEYIPISVDSFTNNIGVAEKGSTISTINFNFSTNKEALSLSIDNGIGIVNGNSFAKNGLSISSNTTFTISATDEKKTATKTSSIRFDNRMFYGSSSKTSFTNADILALQNSVLVNSKNRTLSLNGNSEYPVIAFEASLGTPTFIMAGLVNTDWIITQQNVTNASGYTTLYNVCRMNTIQNSSSISITIQ